MNAYDPHPRFYDYPQRNRRKRTRFLTETGWTLVFVLLFWALALWVWIR